MPGVGPWPGVGAGKEKKYAPPQAGEWAGAANFTGGPCFMGPRRPCNEHYIKVFINASSPCPYTIARSSSGILAILMSRFQYTSYVA